MTTPKLSKEQKKENKWAKSHSTAHAVKSYGRSIGGPGLRTMNSMPQVVGSNRQRGFVSNVRMKNEKGRSFTAKAVFTNVKWFGRGHTGTSQKPQKRHRTSYSGNPDFMIPYQPPRFY